MDTLIIAVVSIIILQTIAFAGLVFKFKKDTDTLKEIVERLSDRG